MTPEELRDCCLALPQAIETFPFGEETSVFKTSGNNRIFALTELDAALGTADLRPGRDHVPCDCLVELVQPF